MPLSLARWFLVTAVMLLALDTVLRLCLLVNQHASPSAAQVCLIMGGGMLRDAGAILLLGAFPAALIALARPPAFARLWLRWSLAAAILGTAAFLAAVEWFFFDEFSSRFNHIALDYVLFPYEVLTNIWESYNVPLFIGLAALAGGVLALPHLRPAATGPAAAGWRDRLTGAAVACGAGAIGFLVSAYLPAGGHATDRRLREVAGNGLLSLIQAARTSHLDYDAFYATGDPAASATAVATGRGTGTPLAFPQRRFDPVGRPGVDRPDVVVVLEESLGSEFIGCLGGRPGLSAGFDRWSGKGLLLTDLFAGGNRTVRGLEGVLCSFPPLPGDAIVKRDRTEGAASLAQVFDRAGYRTEFVYGGAGSFDNLRNFALQTGYRRFLDDGILGTGAFPRDAFRTAWGVADGHLFDLVLERQRLAAADREPLFLTALTVSNHKPFLVPSRDGDPPTWDTRHLQRYVLIGIGVLIACAALLWWGRRSLGTGIAVALALGLAIAFPLYVYQRMKPSGSRTQAVTYAIGALTTWLDRAEADGLLRHTVVLVVGDHGARVYGTGEIPLASYRIPALLITPEPAWRGRRVDRLCAQLDLAPTLLSLSGIGYTAPFFGEDVLRGQPGPGRAFLQHNRDIAIMDDASLVAFGLQKTIDRYQRTGLRGETLAPRPDDAEETKDLERLGISTYQTADRLYLGREFHLP